MWTSDIFRDHNGRAFRMYGDSIYASKANAYLHAPFTGVLILESHQRFNRAMASFRIAVEWRYAEARGSRMPCPPDVVPIKKTIRTAASLSLRLRTLLSHDSCSIGKLKVICRLMKDDYKHLAFKTAPGRVPVVSAVITNAHTTLYGSQCSR